MFGLLPSLFTPHLLVPKLCRCIQIYATSQETRCIDIFLFQFATRGRTAAMKLHTSVGRAMLFKSRLPFKLCGLRGFTRRNIFYPLQLECCKRIMQERKRDAPNHAGFHGNPLNDKGNNSEVSFSRFW